jgi:hypothetical protein
VPERTTSAQEAIRVPALGATGVSDASTSRSRRVDLGTLNISAARWILEISFFLFKADIANRILPS